MRLVLIGVVAVLILTACSPVSATNGAEPASVFDSTPAYSLPLIWAHGSKDETLESLSS
jgi:hypothetical protein